MSGGIKKGWCPTALRPMQSGDGWLARVASPEEGLSRPQVQALANLATTFGNGQIEITPRLNWQLRGLQIEEHADFLDEARKAALVTSRDDGPVPLVVSPFPDESLGGIASRIRSAVAALSPNAKFPGKFCVVLSAAGRFGLSELKGDLRIDQHEGHWQLALAGTSASAAPVMRGPVDRVVAAASALLAAAAGMALDERPEGSILLARWLTLAGLESQPGLQPLEAVEGKVPEAHALLELPFGRLKASDLASIATTMPDEARLAIAPGRVLALQALLDPAVGQQLGWVMSSSDPRRHIAVCTGAPACAHGFAETLVLAEEVAKRIATQRPTVHVSGCAKGCAMREPADIAITAAQGGFYVARNTTAAGALSGLFFASKAALLEALAA